MRLQALLASVDDPTFNRGFVAPSPIASWVRYLVQMEPTLDVTARIPHRHARNIGYRFQLMEFECGLLHLDREVKEQFAGSSTLHETISRFKIQQYAVLANAILEGIGAHLSRIKDVAANVAVNDQDIVRTQKWHSHLQRKFRDGKVHKQVQ